MSVKKISKHMYAIIWKELQIERHEMTGVLCSQT